MALVVESEATPHRVQPDHDPGPQRVKQRHLAEEHRVAWPVAHAGLTVNLSANEMDCQNGAPDDSRGLPPRGKVRSAQAVQVPFKLPTHHA